ncbi:metal-dependent transcriptional regulator [Anoxybacterium hadale]|uniref:Metal-dependent transcriptional regulator n=1 Tax=Anoxybacterium hadale TaxID=3408580 RepID=A0ACD1A698_9FIRM|nr:metal-dependent transcriptional regulator [Clostridiales bacterium]
MIELSNSKEHYLRAIYKLSAKEGCARITDIAIELGVTKASTCRAVKELEEMMLVCKDSVHRVYLTEKGKNTVIPIVKNYEKLKNFFVSTLGVNELEAGILACALEHVIDIERYIF